MDNKKYHNLFLSSATQHITQLKKTLASLQEGKNGQEIVEAMHIGAHSLKGECLVMDYQSLGLYITILEKYFKRLLDNHHSIPFESLPLLLEAVKKIEIFVSEVEHERKPEVAAEAIGALRQQLEVTDA